ncbi:MAG TPA: S41 family peptidase, partial [Caldilineaceae bacterium]|nr:S41 family peptidase [Caldilineaceae bacterium]
MMPQLENRRRAAMPEPIDGLYRQPWLLAGVAVVLLAAVFGLGMGFGYGLGRQTAVASSAAPAAGERAGAASCVDDGSAQARLCPYFGIYWEAMELLYRDYYGELPAPEDVATGAIRGVLELVNDPNTSFLTPDEAEYFRTSLEGAFEGIGARVGWDAEANTLVITEPFENQPAWKAGLRRNDLILEVDGTSLVGTKLEEAVRMIRGPKGTDVALTVQRPGQPDPFVVRVMRDRIEIPTISTDMLGEAGDIAYIRLNAFNENAGQLVREAVRGALQREPRGMILDLRGNTGGLLREAIKVASVFIEDTVVLHERFSDGTVETYRTLGEAAVAPNLPLVVLVNESSASASEIVAGALQDTGRAVLIGATTYGKGSVQLPHTLSNGAILRVTIARWYTPNNRTIDGVGLTPDQVVEVTDETDQRAPDLQLQAALAHFDRRQPASAQTAQTAP